jgi:hypothetical protein
VASGTAWVEIVIAVIGSSLIGILLTNFATDYNQPKIRIDVTCGRIYLNNGTIIPKCDLPENISQSWQFNTIVVNKGIHPLQIFG